MHSLNTKVLPFGNITLIACSFESSIVTITPFKFATTFKGIMFSSDDGYSKPSLEIFLTVPFLCTSVIPHMQQPQVFLVHDNI